MKRLEFSATEGSTRTKRNFTFLFKEDGKVVREETFIIDKVSIGNKLEVLLSFVYDIFSKVPKVEELTYNFYSKYISLVREELYEDAFDELKKYYDNLYPLLDSYLKISKVLDKYVYKGSEKYKDKEHVVLSKEEVDSILVSSISLRFYALLYMSNSLLLPDRLHFDAFRIATKKMSDLTIQKIDKIVRMNVFAYLNENTTKIAKFLNINRNIEPYSYSLQMLYFILYIMLPTIKMPVSEGEKEVNTNVIGYLVSIVKTKLDYLVKGQEKHLYVVGDVDEDLTGSATKDNQIVLVLSIYETIIPTLRRVLKKYSGNNNVVSNLMYSLRADSPIIRYITQLFVKQALKLDDMYKLPTKVIKALNLFTYQLIDKMDPNLVNIKKLLFTYDIPKRRLQQIEEGIFINDDRLSDSDLNDIIDIALKTYKIQLEATTTSFVKAVIKDAVKALMDRNYFNLRTKVKVNVDWKAFTFEYCRFISFLKDGTYEPFFEELMCKVKEIKDLDDVNTYTLTKSISL